MSGKEIFEENLKQWLDSIPEYVKRIAERVEEARQDGEEIGFNENTYDYLKNPKNWELEWLDSEALLEELELGSLGDEGHVETTETEKLKMEGYEECNQYVYTPKDEDLADNYRIEVYTSPVDDQYLAWCIVED